MRLKSFAACAHQGAIELLRTEQDPRQVVSPNSSSRKIRLSFFGIAEPSSSTKVKEGIRAKDGTDHQQRAEYGAHLLCDFQFPDVLGQTSIIRFIISGHGIETTDWLVVSLFNGAVVKAWNPNYIPGPCPTTLAVGLC